MIGVNIMEQDEALKKFGYRVKERRAKVHLSQEYVASVMGYKHKSSIQKIEKGIADIPRTKLPLLAETLKTTPAYLNGDTDDPDDYDTRIDKYIDAPYPLDKDGNIDKAALRREYEDLFLSDPRIYELNQNLMAMSVAHREIIYSTAAEFAKMDSHVTD